MSRLDELSAAQKRALLRRALQQADPPGDVAGLTEEEVDARLRDLVDRRPDPGGPRRYPVSLAQRQMWILEHFDPGQAVYHMDVKLRLLGPLDVPALERALVHLFARHESLRTRFVIVDAEPVQEVVPTVSVRLPRVSVASADQAMAVLGKVFAAPIDMGRAPLMRQALLEQGPDDHVLNLVAHHSVLDEHSFTILLRDLAELYQAERTNSPASLPVLRRTYGRYAAAQRDPARTALRERHLAYWLRNLAGAPRLLELPTDRPRPAAQTYRGGHRRLSLPPRAGAAVSTLCARHGTTPFQVLLTTFAVVLAQLSQQPEVVIGTAVGGRTEPDLQDVVGNFVTTVALRIRLSGDPTPGQALAAVRDECLSALEHASVGFDEVVARLRPERSTSHPPVFQVMYLHNADDLESVMRWDGLRAQILGVPSIAARFDLTLVTWAEAERLAGRVDYSTDLFDAATIDRWGGHLVRVLCAMADEPERGVRSVALDEPSAPTRDGFSETELV